MKRREGSVFGTIALIIAVITAIGGGGYAVYRWVNQGSDGPVVRIAETEVAYASQNLLKLFKSAQQDFIHRNGQRMAGTIEELGDGFSIGASGTIIYREIWCARFGRPESDIPSRDQLEDWDKNALDRPYRYAVLPVRNLESDALDARTTALIALPVAETDSPALLMLAGPIRKDPQDFLRDWSIHRIVTPEGLRLIRQQVEAEKPYDKTFHDTLFHHFEEPL